MKKFLFTLLLTSVYIMTFSQQGVVASGTTIKNSTGSVAASIGQISYAFVSNGSQSISQGVQQTYEITTAINTIDENIHIEIMPNPTTHNVHLSIQEYQANKYRYSLFDISGNKLQNNKITSALTRLDLQSLPASTYLLQVIDHTQATKTFKIIKTN